MQQVEQEQNQAANQHHQVSNFLAKEFFDYGLMSFYQYQQNKQNNEDKADDEDKVKNQEQEIEQESNKLINDKDLQLKYKEEIDYIRWFHSFHNQKFTKSKRK
ncbi:hypothetical protein TTHERM_01054400 (macronuclear) [Tetrahymena thermophila SB210]|uniref:Uncharacterized protein n=1 Tax=Tetrahymena thermophila (strain SB210) TaxID=312017 RepID=Q22CB1_TETTS|nr:hypothetical protein TTHERM_01054400 [Tetrahymena thermophila SB210]EAR82955.2 hypothetical protein TTHERM_01054400 [Tetrahymena thermophila SB210]|eukprot:XP_001030618.2 hypothetical protein TTHERM_01054400 [Tetrahymena thermophila SB210]